MDGSGNTTFIIPSIRKGFAVTVFEDFVYFFDGGWHYIRSFDKIQGSLVTLSHSSLSEMDLKIYHDLHQDRRTYKNRQLI